MQDWISYTFINMCHVGCVAWWWKKDPDADIQSENLIYYKIQTKSTAKPEYQKPDKHLKLE